jgi:DNA replication protein DnaC
VRDEVRRTLVWLVVKVLTEREEKASIAVGSNEPFSSWTKTFTDPRLCAAGALDRLTYNGQIIETGTTSYRLAHARARPAQSNGLELVVLQPGLRLS